MTSVLRWEGVATAQSSIVHSAEALGTVSYLRRERFLSPAGVLEEIPVISGNAWRGLLRDRAADLWWEAAGKPQLTLAVMHALWSGGALAKVSGPTLTGARLQELRALCPVVGVFGTAGGGRIIGGALQVGKMLPICEETRHLLPAHLAAGPLPTMWDLTQIEYYSRFPNDPARADVADEDEDKPRLARYGVETFIAGTRFYTWCSLTWPTPAQEAFFAEVLADFVGDAHVGGMNRTGHGRLALDLVAPGKLTVDTAWRPDMAGAAPARLREVLSWLD